MQKLSAGLKQEGRKIGFIPTMGYLHEGHISLVNKSKSENDVTVTSIYVNPTQFGQNEDYGKYPRDFDRDNSILEKAGCDILFYPEDSAIYPAGYQTYINVQEITKVLEGEFRPGHFTGVATIVNILFNIVKPDRAYFGQKDAQQCAVIQQMTLDLKLDVEIRVMPIVRERDGLAMSSRNKYLNEKERKDALDLFRALSMAKGLIESGERNTELIEKKMMEILKSVDSSAPDYTRIVNSRSFDREQELREGVSYYLLIACRIGATRLIDNFLLTVN